MPLAREIKYELDEFPIVVAGIEVGLFFGCAYVYQICLDGVSRKMTPTAIGCFEKAKAEVLVLGPKDEDPGKAFLFKSIADQIEGDPKICELFEDAA